MAIDGIPGKQIFRQRDVRRTPASVQTQTQTNVAPIGAIFPWLKSFANTPALISGWVECNGQTLNDGDSVYNGQVIPNLNGNNQFMRGNSTSGGTGGSATMAHEHNLFSGGTVATTSGSASNKISTHSTAAQTAGDDNWGAGATYNLQRMQKQTETQSNTENRPPFYNVVWIMRIK